MDKTSSDAEKQQESFDLDRWVGGLFEALKESFVVVLEIEEQHRFPILKEFIERKKRTGNEQGLVVRDASRTDFSILEEWQKYQDGGWPEVMLIDRFESLWVHPDEWSGFQRALGEFESRRGRNLLVGIEKGARWEEGLFPERILEEAMIFDLESLAEFGSNASEGAETSLGSSFAYLFPPLGSTGVTRRAIGPTAVEATEEIVVPRDPRRGSPVRRLLEILKEIHGDEEDLRINIEEDEDFSSMVGPFEARFCEWTYHQLEHRRLGRKILASHVLSPAQARKMAKYLGVPLEELKDLGREAQIRVVLEALGIKEPRLPPVLEDGVRELWALKESFDREEQGWSLSLDEEKGGPEALVPAARRGAERLLKIIAQFLWGAELEEVFFDVVTKSLQDFRGGGVQPDVGSSDWLLKLDLGSLNHLVRAVDRERKSRGKPLLFLRDRDDYWQDAIFHPFNQLATALNREVHEGHNLEERRRMQKKAVGDVIRIIERGTVRIPQVVQFYRRFSDDLGEHYEGWTFQRGSSLAAPEEMRIKFYEMEHHHELHEPYLFLAATNPSAVDMVCEPLRKEFLGPV